MRRSPVRASLSPGLKAHYTGYQHAREHLGDLPPQASSPLYRESLAKLDRDQEVTLAELQYYAREQEALRHKLQEQERMLSLV